MTKTTKKTTAPLLRHHSTPPPQNLYSKKRRLLRRHLSFSTMAPRMRLSISKNSIGFSNLSFFFFFSSLSSSVLPLVLLCSSLFSHCIANTAEPLNNNNVTDHQINNNNNEVTTATIIIDKDNIIASSTTTTTTAILPTTDDQFRWKFPEPTHAWKDVELRRHSIHSIDGVFLTSLCAQLCLKDFRCKSFNFLTEKNKCLLNGKTDEDFPSDLAPSNGSLFLRREDFSVADEALGLCAENPCQNNGRCIETCGGGGEETRRKECLCVDSNWEGKFCQKRAAQPEWTEWGNFTECTVSCGKGVHIRRRHCVDAVSQRTRSNLDCVGSDVQFRACETASCPAFTAWSEWSACSADATCGEGKRERRRECSRGGVVDVDPRCVGPTYDWTPCVSVDCYAPLRLVADADAGVIGVGRLQIFDTGKFHEVCGEELEEVDARVACRQMGFRGGRVLPPSPTPITTSFSTIGCTGTESTLVACRRTTPLVDVACPTGAAVVACVVDGAWGAWRSWSACGVTCGNGTRARNRKCDWPAPAEGGAACAGDEAETDECRRPECPVDGEWKEWGTWAECDKACGGGSRRRDRVCVEPVFGGRPCSGASQETETCNEHACPIGGAWNAWSEWTACSASCAGGKTKRRRTCEGAMEGEDGCQGEAEEEGECNSQPCPSDGAWSAWSAWSECSASCGGGHWSRTRACDPPPRFGGKECEGEESEEGNCGETACPVDGFWSEWGPWHGGCSKGCGGGEEFSNRTCIGPSHGGRRCDGDDVKTRSCNTGKCPIDGTWKDWSDWSHCSTTCGDGVRDRSRDCHGPFYGGDECQGRNTERETCTSEPCPVDGVWLEWSNFTTCSVTCGVGVRKRVRACEGPFHRGEACPGDAEESETCGEAATCPVDGVWAEWREWSPCLVSCGGGERFRTRICIEPQNGGKPCKGDVKEKGQCGQQHCPVSGSWSGWSEWYACECPAGIRRRYRRCRGSLNGGTCPGTHRDEDNCECS